MAETILLHPTIDELIPFSTASRLSGFTDRHLRKLASQGELWSIKLGRNWFTTPAAIEEYLAKGKRPGRKPKRPTNSH